MTTIYAPALQILDAAMAGAKRGYNRSNTDATVYEKLLNECYEYCNSLIQDELIEAKVRSATHGNWFEATLPVSLALIHHHKHFKECEAHARVYLPNAPSAVFDIPLPHWQRLINKHGKRTAQRKPQ